MEKLNGTIVSNSATNEMAEAVPRQDDVSSCVMYTTSIKTSDVKEMMVVMWKDRHQADVGNRMVPA